MERSAIRFIGSKKHEGSNLPTLVERAEATQVDGVLGDEVGRRQE